MLLLRFPVSFKQRIMNKNSGNTDSSSSALREQFLHFEGDVQLSGSGERYVGTFLTLY